jgi:hypothetical protein
MNTYNVVIENTENVLADAETCGDCTSFVSQNNAADYYAQCIATYTNEYVPCLISIVHNGKILAHTELSF